jgi:hypothetical protein
LEFKNSSYLAGLLRFLEEESEASSSIAAGESSFNKESK